MKIAFVHHSLALGGSERVSFDVARRLMLRRGVRSYFFAQAHNAEQWTPPSENAEDVLLLPSGEKLFSESNQRLMAEHVQRLGIAVLIVAVPERTVPELVRSLSGCRLVFYQHSIPFWEARRKIESARTQGERSWYNWLVWHLIKKPIFTWGNVYRDKIMRVYREHIRHYDAYIVLCHQYRDELIESLRLSPEESQRIYTVINTQPIAQAPSADKSKEIVYMGRLSRGDKRVDRLLRIWQLAQLRLAGWRLIIYGAGKDARYLKRLSERLRLQSVEFRGFVADTSAAYATASVLCLTSSYEGWPLALAEAQNHGVVPMAFDCSAGVRAIIGQDGEFGRLIPPYQLSTYAEALVQTCLDGELRAGIIQRMLAHRESYAEGVNDAVWDELLRLTSTQQLTSNKYAFDTCTRHSVGFGGTTGGSGAF